MYIIFEGTVQVFINGAYVSEVGAKNIIGENSMWSPTLRSATIMAKTPVLCIELKEEDYKKTVLSQKLVDQHEVSIFLRQIPLFRDWLQFRI